MADASLGTLLDVSRETSAKLEAFVALLLKWQERINLIGDSTRDALWTRHILDSAQLLPLAPPNARRWVDLGSGAGFPGVVIALLLAERTSGASVTLIESNRKKAAFLTEAIRATEAPAKVVAKRIEDALNPPPPCDVVTARALAPLPKLLTLAAPLLMKGARGLFPKGRDAEAELTEAAKSWTIDAELLPSQTDPNGRILCVKALASRQPN